ncbi:AbrB family transcriptional regulator [Lactiplantibacillus mudanjiangensis]|uniref:AbrB family transcriptional regulator [Lactobacillus sp.] n=1 Tax=Lactiplantibacillus mudanjiangensis TaxID=1296538 RepID=A0A660E6L9_9LACO|nr:AbrB family transcriptional regulator [Lactiplantibacillus mudanjiangensis]VDG18176.1 AbrB family transcriptional regulator [Lactobacillus sp.] [Lactiplantibacillus mudanjiangensis]VDG25868.1 AbrB family transcriptional regulator [Lactobacillus sp.] [Lactiplantibacillus mudanjiangensis]VDG28703.1 AbrB family transcriptional regulator [Lactobacillus sp.] [Lactiplantibacillus mudanjiangensis]VDG33703.1 AbrB family transcriptional regulator [Lactobacillus sp.] [Lactiplantibacillus mudanjiangens
MPKEAQKTPQAKRPTAKDWKEAIRGLPVERVYLNPDGTVDKQKSPYFYEWMTENDSH